MVSGYVRDHLLTRVETPSPPDEAAGWGTVDPLRSSGARARQEETRGRGPMSRTVARGTTVGRQADDGKDDGCRTE